MFFLCFKANLIEPLVRLGANVNARSRDRRTALHFAAERGHTQYKYILKTIDAKNMNLHFVCVLVKRMYCLFICFIAVLGRWFIME